MICNISGFAQQLHIHQSKKKISATDYIITRSRKEKEQDPFNISPEGPHSPENFRLFLVVTKLRRDSLPCKQGCVHTYVISVEK